MIEFPISKEKESGKNSAVTESRIEYPGQADILSVALAKRLLNA
jgi:hypothetical protein